MKQESRHIVHGKGCKYICMAPETFMEIKHMLKINDLTVVAAHFNSIQVGLAYLDGQGRGKKT